VAAPLALRSVARDDHAAASAPAALPGLFGPHLAYGIDSAARFGACENAGFGWFSGDYILGHGLADGDDGSSRRRLFTMLALLARDADSHELEALLKQDAALSYHLLKLVNSAAFSGGTQVSNFAQAITRLGRRQMQRWLQLLLYARAQPDHPPNLMLPLAALRGAMLEALCKHDDCDRDEQDQAFMAGVFSLLDRLFGMPMTDIVRDLNLPDHVNAALLGREGALGQRLRLLEGGAPDTAALGAAGIDPSAWWDSQRHAYHWAIQVARHV
jgi:EAL and modified HD-GYP domain-containing signal transduction protein